MAGGGSLCVICCVSLILVVVQCQDDNFAVSYDILEEQGAGVLIGNLITDSGLDTYYSSEALQEIHFKVMQHSSMYEKYFRIDGGLLRTNAKLDRDELCPNLETCDLELDLAIQPIAYFNILKVVLRIMDLNDNTPSFKVPAGEIHIDVSETALENSEFVLPPAVDPDSGVFAVQDYRLYGAESGIFQLSVVNNPGGVTDVKLVLKEKLDREAVDSYQLQLVAIDGGNPQLSGSLDIVVDVVDVNDNPPVFDKPLYEVIVREDIQVGATFLQVHASDADSGNNGKITYSLASSTDASVSSLFAINRSTGAVYTLAPLDHEAGDVYFLSLVAADSGAPSSLKAYSKVRVSVEDMNDHAPLISIHALTGSHGRVQVLENAPPTSTFVAQVSVSDSDSGDNGRFTCSLQSPHFSLHQAGPGQFKVLTSVSFDREERDMYHMNLVCRDQGAQPQTSTKYVVVEVVDVNDNEPEFSQPSLSLVVAENQEVGSLLGQVNATDLDSGDNARIRYSIVPPGVLHVHPDTGAITTAIVLDHEKKAEHDFIITATDHGSPAKSSTMNLKLVVKDTNDNAPQFSEKIYTFGTFENQPENTEIGTLAAYDADSAPYNVITYSLDQTFSDSAVFEIDSRTGKLVCRKMLDREMKAKYHLKVLASNEGYYLTGSTNVTIHVADKNDNPPNVTFPTDKNHTIQISTLTPVGSSIAQIEARDPDLGNNAALTFSIVSGNEAGFFQINPLLGQVLVDRDLEEELSHLESIVILVQDQGTPALSSVAQLDIFLNDSMAVLATIEDAKSGADSTAILVICLLVFAITIIVAVLFVLLVIRRKRNQQQTQKYNCRLAADKKLGGDSSSDNIGSCGPGGKECEPNNQPPGSKSVSWKPDVIGESIVIENPRAHSSPMEKISSDRALGRKQGRNACTLREIQLQVHDLLDPHQGHHDPDSDSLTDSGKGPSEEGDGTRIHSDSTDDNIQPPLPPRQAKMPCVQRPNTHHHHHLHQPHLHEDYTNSWPRNEASNLPKRNKSDCIRPASVLGVNHNRIPETGGSHYNRQYSDNYSNGSVYPYYVNQTGKPVHYPQDMHVPVAQRLSHEGSLQWEAPASCPSGPAPHLGGHRPYCNLVKAPVGQEHDTEESEQSCDDDGDSSTSGSFMVELEDGGGFGKDIIV